VLTRLGMINILCTSVLGLIVIGQTICLLGNFDLSQARSR
jgi:hypothetical protein